MVFTITSGSILKVHHTPMSVHENGPFPSLLILSINLLNTGIQNPGNAYPSKFHGGVFLFRGTHKCFPM